MNKTWWKLEELGILQLFKHTSDKIQNNYETSLCWSNTLNTKFKINVGNCLDGRSHHVGEFLNCKSVIYLTSHQITSWNYLCFSERLSQNVIITERNETSTDGASTKGKFWCFTYARCDWSVTLLYANTVVPSQHCAFLFNKRIWKWTAFV